MRRINVKNIGPIKDAHLELKKINILIGQQSTGKSTLAKIACYCSWVEKEICIAQSPYEFEKENYFTDNLTRFHKLNGYISPESVITYNSQVLSFEFSNGKFKFNWNQGRLDYQRSKTLYIPAERNIVSVIPNWFEVNLEFNSTRSFLADWERVRKFYSKDNPLTLLDFGEFYHNPSDGTDHVITKNNVDTLLGYASSGLQTLAPLQALIKYYSDDFYKSDLKWSESNVKGSNIIKVLSKKLFDQLLETLTKEELDNWNELTTTLLTDKKNLTNEEIQKITYPNEDIMNKHIGFLDQFYLPNSTSFFIEEPELNLYPITQYKLMNSIIEMINGMNHTLFITTHSTYILTTLSNLIYAGEVGLKHNGTENIIPKNRWINKNNVSAWKIDANTNMLHDLVVDDLHMLKSEELDDVSDIINNKFDQLFELKHQDE